MPEIAVRKPLLAAGTVLKRHLIFALALGSCFAWRPAAAQNPIFDQGSADPSVKVFDGRAYVYGTHDFSASDSTWIAKDWHVFSSSDLVNWTDAGVVLDDDSLAWRRVGDRDWAPDATFFNGRYYFYFPLGDLPPFGHDMIGVAAGDSPSGPFIDVLGRPLADGSTTPARNIDPMAFEDVDGARYLLWGNGSCYVAQLNDDMASFKTPPQLVKISGAPSYEEGPFAWRHGGKYYLLYSRCGAGCFDSLDYAVGDSIQGPFTYRGTIVAHGKRGNEHGSVFEFNGQWYVAYHDLAPTSYYRKTKLEFIHYTNAGDIPRVYPTDYGVGRYDGSKLIEAENYSDKSPDLDYEDCIDDGNGFQVKNIANGSWLKFQNVDFGVGVESFRARVLTMAGGGTIEVHQDSSSGKLLGTCDVPASGQAWQTLAAKLDGTVSGVNQIVLVFQGTAPELFKLNWIQFVDRDGNPPPGRVASNNTGASMCACVRPAATPDAALASLAIAMVALRRRRQTSVDTQNRPRTHR